MNILHLDSSIQANNSVSRTVSAAIVAHMNDIAAAVSTEYRDLATVPLPHITLAGLGSKQASDVLEQFLAADVLVVGAPMYNFGLPTQLKAWFDHILVAGKTFTYGASGVVGLATGKRVIAALSRGGLYSEGRPASMEHAETHLRAMLGFIGITEVEIIVIEGVALGPAERDGALQAALARVGRLPLL